MISQTIPTRSGFYREHIENKRAEYPDLSTSELREAWDAQHVWEDHIIGIIRALTSDHRLSAADLSRLSADEWRRLLQLYRHHAPYGLDFEIIAPRPADGMIYVHPSIR